MRKEKTKVFLPSSFLCEHPNYAFLSPSKQQLWVTLSDFLVDNSGGRDEHGDKRKNISKFNVDHLKI